MVDKTFELEPNEALKQKKEANHEASDIVDLKKNNNNNKPPPPLRADMFSPQAAPLT